MTSIRKGGQDRSGQIITTLRDTNAERRRTANPAVVTPRQPFSRRTWERKPIEDRNLEGVPGHAPPSGFQRTRQAAADGEVRIHAHRIPKGLLENVLRRVRTKAFRAHGPQVAMDFRDEFAEVVQASLDAADHLFEDGLPEFLVVRREAMFHLRLDPGRFEMPNALEEGMEVGDVEIDDFAKRPRVVGEVDVEPEAGRSQPILEGPRIVRSSLQEA